MSASAAELKRARSLRWGVPLVLLVVGLILAKGSYTYGRDYLQLAEGLALMVLGAGMLYSFRWARWLGMGACFLVIVLACAYPLWVLLVDPFSYLEKPLHQALFLGVFVFVIGALAFKKLAYLRSPMGRDQYSAKKGEGSAGVLVSAMLWATVMFFIYAGTRVDTVVAKPAQGAARVPDNLADLMIEELCSDGEFGVMVRVANRGNGGGGEDFQVSYSSTLPGEGVGRGVAWGVAPEPGEDTLVDIGYAEEVSGTRPITEYVQVQLDSTNHLREKDEKNNEQRFAVGYKQSRLTGLPPCYGYKNPIIPRTR